MHVRTKRFSVAGLIGLVGTLALLLSACGGSSASNGPADKAKDQTIKLTWNTGGGSGDVTTLDPAICYDSSCIPPINIIFDTLVQLDKNDQVVPWGAKSWAVQDGGKTYVFTLQANQKFSDGTPVKASDYAWSLDRQFNPCNGSTAAGTSSLLLDSNASGIVDSSAFAGETCKDGVITGALQTLVGDSIIADDSANTLTIKLNNPSAYFVQSLTLPVSAVIEKSVIGDAKDLGADFSWRDNLAKGPTGQGGSGMFYISKWDHTSILQLKANPNWWGRTAGLAPNFTEVDFNMFDTTDTLYQTYQSDQSYAFSDGIPTDQIAAAKSQPDYHEYTSLSVETVGFNWNIAPFNDVNARKAFCLALNRDQLNTSILKGTSQPSWHLVPPGMPGYFPDLKGIGGAPTAGDPTAAKAAWAAYLATLNGKPVPAVTLSFNFASNTQKLLAEAYQATWKELFPEANVTINQNAWATQVPLLIQHKMQLGRFGWLADYPDPQDFLSVIYETGAPNDYFNSSVAPADALLKQADAITDPSQATARLQLYNQAEQQLVDNVAVCPLFTGLGHYQLRTWVKGDFVIAPNGNFPNSAWVTGYIANH